MSVRRARWEAAPDRAAVLRSVLRRRHREALRADPALGARLARYVPDFWAAYAAVYGEAHERAGEALALLEAALDACRNRPEPLRHLDSARAGRDDWYQQPGLVGLSLYVDRFAGTLGGLRERLPYLRELGVTYVHLMPLLATREGPDDGGYAVSDYRRVALGLGTMDDLRALAADLHEAGMLLAVDFVMNHTAREHAWAQQALAGDPEHQAFYLMFDDRTLPDAYERTLPEVFPDFAPGNFTFVPEVGRWVWTSFYDFQWDLNYRNPAVFAAMFAEMLFLTQAGVDVLRLDAVPFLWKEKGTDCRNRPEAHALVRAYRALMRIAAPGVLFKAEAIVAPDEIVRYLGTGGYEGKACELAYNATLMCHLWHALACENVQLLRTALTVLPPTPDTAVWLNYVRCHDDIGWGLSDADCAAVGQHGPDTRRFCSDFYAGRWPGSYAEGYRFQVDRRTGEARTSGTAAALTGLQKALVEADAPAVEAALARLLLLYNVVFSMRGAPLLYAGDELGQCNDLSYLDDPLRAGDNRWVHRPPMDWARAERRHVPGTVPHRLFSALRRFAAVRRAQAALHARAEEHVLFAPNDRLFVVERVRGTDRLLAVSNFSRHPQAMPLGALPEPWQGGRFTDLYTGEPVIYASGEVLLPPYGFRWLVPATETPPPVRTRLRLPVETHWGEAVAVTGAPNVLGGGDPRRALPLTPDEYPFWGAEITLPAGTHFTFRWLKLRDGHPVARSEKTYWMKAGEMRIFEC